MPKIKVGGSPVKCKWQEYAASIMPKGTPVAWEARPLLTWPGGPKEERGTGVFEFASWYDGVCAHIDAHGVRKILFMEHDKMRRLKGGLDTAGEGI